MHHVQLRNGQRALCCIHQTWSSHGFPLSSARLAWVCVKVGCPETLWCSSWLSFKTHRAPLGSPLYRPFSLPRHMAETHQNGYPKLQDPYGVIYLKHVVMAPCFCESEGDLTCIIHVATKATVRPRPADGALQFPHLLGDLWGVPHLQGAFSNLR